MKINHIPNEEFYSIPFYVDKRVLIPRNDTEILVDKVLKEIIPPSSISFQSTLFEKGRNNGEFILIDVWTWSGAIPIAIVKNAEISKVFALDISLEALVVAKINIDINKVQDKIELFHSDLLDVFLSWKLKIETSNIIITANLPYIKDGDIDNMDKEVLENEPHLALFGWPKTGFELYEKLISQIFELKKIYKLNITLFIEIWFDQYEYSSEYLSSIWLKFEYFKDLNNIYRVIKIDFN